jgi:hypothetical protein
MGRNGALVTDRDRALLTFVAQHRLVLTSHIQVLLLISQDAARARLRTLRTAGLLGGERFFHGQPPCWWITRKGLALIGSRLPPPRIDLSSYRHDVGLGWIWLAAQRGAFGPLREVVCERTMRSRDGGLAQAARAGPEPEEPFGVRLGGVGPAGRERLHYADLLMITPGGGRIGVELELSTKERARRERILSGYAADPRLDAVLYLIDRPAVARAIEGSAARLGIFPMVHVQRVQWDSGRNSERGLEAERSRIRSSDARERAGALER